MEVEHELVNDHLRQVEPILALSFPVQQLHFWPLFDFRSLQATFCCEVEPQNLPNLNLKLGMSHCLMPQVLKFETFCQTEVGSESEVEVEHGLVNGHLMDVEQIPVLS